MKATIALILSFAWNFASAADAPPKIFVDKGACPFECCMYREWTARKNLKLFNKINGGKVVTTIKKDEVVTGVTGEVHLKPTPMEVVYKHGPFKKGDKIYLLTNEGEGFQKVWHKGKVTSEELTFLYNYGNDDKGCTKPSEDCWGKILGEQSGDWWVQIKTKDGKIGWTKESDQFSGMDACGS